MQKRSVLFLPIFLAIATILGGTFIYYYQQSYEAPEQRLPVIQPIDVNSILVDSSLMYKGHSHIIEEYELLDQIGDTFNSSNLEGKVHVADFFFTTCGSICPIMTNHLSTVRDAYKDSSDFELISVTVLPEIDSVETMANYAAKFSADPEKWHFLTGDKQAIYDLARKSYFTLKPKEVGDESHDIGSDFIHTDNIVLVDKHQRIRGYYSGVDSVEVAKLIADIQKLLKEK